MSKKVAPRSRKKSPAKKLRAAKKSAPKLARSSPNREKPKSLKSKPRHAPKINVISGYDAFRQSQAQISRNRSAKGRDIGSIPDIADPDRRERCSRSLRLFCETYNSAAFSMAWSDDQIRSIARIEEAVTLGALYAMAEPRGNGKTTRCRMASLWASSNALRRYVYLINATDAKAGDALDSLKTFFRFLPDFSADYPEISYPIQSLEGIANRANGQTCNGMPTLIEWTADRIVLPTVAPPANWPKHWPLRADGMVPTSGALVATSGLTGEGIRGSLKTLTTGEQVRPDLVLLDDPQTNESARSRTQNVTREQLISADVLGMAGPGKTISAVMPCTVIAPGDCIDRLTDRAKHPSWRGERTRMLRSMPKNMTAWDSYFEVYRRCLLKEPPDMAEANDHYLANREELDGGAEASWRERKLSNEVSAIQSAMHLFFRDRRAFMSEYQNDPEPIDLGQLDDLNAGDIAKKLNHLPRSICPREANQVTVGIDVQSTILFYSVVAWLPNFGGSVIDYGTWPKQARSYFAANDARPSLADKFAGFDETARIFAGLKVLIGEVVGRKYQREGGGELSVSRALIDAGKWDQAIRDVCRHSSLSALLLPSKGYGIGAGSSPMANWAPKPGEKRGENWIERPNTGGGRGRLVLIDTNHWKTFLAHRLQTPDMGAGCLQLFGTPETDHQLFADHLTAEYRVQTQGRGRKLDEWKLRADRPENHWWDTLVYAAVAAAQLGLKFSAAVAAGEALPPTRTKKPKRSLLAEFNARSAERNGGYLPP